MCAFLSNETHSSGQPKHVGRRQALPPPAASGTSGLSAGRRAGGFACRVLFLDADGLQRLGLHLIQPVIHALLLQQFDGGARFRHLPVFDDNQPVGVAEGGEAMGDDDGRAVLGQTVERRLDLPLGLRVHRRRSPRRE